MRCLRSNFASYCRTPSRMSCIMSGRSAPLATLKYLSSSRIDVWLMPLSLENALLLGPHNLFCLVWSSISCFSDENVSHKSPMCTSGKITTVPRLFSEHSTQNGNKHQIMNIHTKWDCLKPILSGLVKY